MSPKEQQPPDEEEVKHVEVEIVDEEDENVFTASPVLPKTDRHQWNDDFYDQGTFVQFKAHGCGCPGCLGIGCLPVLLCITGIILIFKAC